MTWHASLLQSIIERKNDPDMTIARKLSDLTQKQWQQLRQQTKAEAKERTKYAEFFVEQRDRGKRKFEDMSATEQQILEDFETQKSARQYEDACLRRPTHFRGKML